MKNERLQHRIKKWVRGHRIIFKKHPAFIDRYAQWFFEFVRAGAIIGGKPSSMDKVFRSNQASKERKSKKKGKRKKWWGQIIQKVLIGVLTAIILTLLGLFIKEFL